MGVTRWPSWVRWLADQSGVYFIRDVETKELLYIGRSIGNLKRTLLRHFGAWGYDLHHQGYRTVFDRCEVEVKIYIVAVEWVIETEADLLAIHKTEMNARSEAARCTKNMETGLF